MRYLTPVILAATSNCAGSAGNGQLFEELNDDLQPGESRVGNGFGQT